MPSIIVTYNPYKQEMDLKYRNTETGKEEEFKGLQKRQKDKLMEFKNNIILQNRIESLVKALKEIYQNNIKLEFIGTNGDFSNLKNEATNMGIQVKKLDDPYINDPEDIKVTITNSMELIKSEIKRLAKEYPEYKDSLIFETSELENTLNDRTPVVIMGNGSSGKSSVFNALIGEEVFPTGDGTTTATVFEIIPTESVFRVGFKTTINAANNNEEVRSGPSSDTATIDLNRDKVEVEKSINECYKNISLPESNNRYEWTYAILNALNQEKNIAEIKVELPFRNLDKCRSKVVFYDTPGPDSKLCTNHKNILINALQRFTKGVCIFVTDPTSLETNTMRDFLNHNFDNKSIETKKNVEDILNINAGIILVNKSDNSSLISMNNAKNIRLNQLGNLNDKENLVLEQNRMIYFSSAIALGLHKSLDASWHDETLKESIEDKQKRFYNMDDGYRPLATLTELPRMRKEAVNTFYKEAEKKYRENPNEENKRELIANNCGLRAFEYELGFIVDRLAICNMCAQAQKQFEKVLDYVKGAIIQISNQLEDNKTNSRIQFDRKYNSIIFVLKDDKNPNSVLCKYKLKSKNEFSKKANDNEEKYNIDIAKENLIIDIKNNWKIIKKDDPAKDIVQYIQTQIKSIIFDRITEIQKIYVSLCDEFLTACREAIEDDSVLTIEEKEKFIKCIENITFPNVYVPEMDSESIRKKFLFIKYYDIKQAIIEAKRILEDVLSDHWKGTYYAFLSAFDESCNNVFISLFNNTEISQLNPELKAINVKIEGLCKQQESFKNFEDIINNKKAEIRIVTELQKRR